MSKLILLLSALVLFSISQAQPVNWTAHWIMHPNSEPQAPELSEWQLMKERGMSTFAEVPLEWGEENQRSECHPWSTAPNYFFFRNVCGVQPTSAGHKTVEIAPEFGELTQIKAVYPHHLGNIELDLRKVDSRVEGTITTPKEMNCTFVWGNQKQNLKAGKQKIRVE